MIRLLTFAFCSLVIVLGGCSSKETQKRPNIVIILADDFGVGDIQAHYPENKITTPYLDKFSAQSMRFTNAHSGAACCTPTRYGLMTGRYAWRTSLQEWVIAAYEPPLIDEGRLTLPMFLQQEGYDTGVDRKVASGLELAWRSTEHARRGAERVE